MKVLKFAVLVALATGLPASGAARRTVRRHPPPPPRSLDVQAAPEIDARVAEEVERVRQILENLNSVNLLTSPYLVSAIYYHDGFLNDFPVDRSTAAPERRIIGQVSKLVSADRKAHFIRLLHEIWAASDAGGPGDPVLPVTYSKSSGGRRTHRYALDLFAPEGAPVRAASRGIVVLADGGWRDEDPFSTASRKGGNSVIVFDPDHDRFYRYCHLSGVQVSAGEIVAAGQNVGFVGHTGLNASQPGHGRHLHFEINEYRGGHVRAFDYQQVRAVLRQWRGKTG